jgi:predicted PP-loop superfamily ATPase
MARETRRQLIERMNEAERRRMQKERDKNAEQCRLNRYGADIDERIQNLIDNQNKFEKEREAGQRSAASGGAGSSANAGYTGPSGIYVSPYYNYTAKFGEDI